MTDWNIVGANRALPPLLEGVDSELLKPPANALRISLHPRGLAPNIVNLGEWRQHLLERLRRQCRISRDPALEALVKELSSYPFGSSERLSNLTVTVFGTPVEITLSEVTLEAFYPADLESA